MRIYWTKEEENELKYYYEELGLSLSELFEEFIKKYPNRTKTSLEVKIGKLKLKHTTDQIKNIKSRLNSGEKNAMFGKESPNKGLNKENCERIKNASEKISKTRKKLYKNGILNTSGINNGMYGKDPWNKGKNKYNDDIIKTASKKMSISKKEYWNNLSQIEKDKIILNLSLAANKAKKDTKIELIIKNKLENMNIKFEKNYPQDKYIFDFYLPDYNFVIECQGDYWHGNPIFYSVLNKIQSDNQIRDFNKIDYLKRNNISSLFLWENEIYMNIDILEKIIYDIYDKKI